MAEKTILVIDDDIDLVEIIRVTLEKKGYRVIDAQNGDRGIALAHEKDPDLIILDVMLREMDEGFQVAYQLRKDKVTSKTPILMLSAVGERTGFEFNPDKDKDFLPVDAFLQKPISPRELVEVVRKYLPTSVWGPIRRIPENSSLLNRPNSSRWLPCASGWIGSTICDGAQPSAWGWVRCGWVGVGGGNSSCGGCSPSGWPYCC